MKKSKQRLNRWGVEFGANCAWVSIDNLTDFLLDALQVILKLHTLPMLACGLCSDLVPVDFTDNIQVIVPDTGEMKSLFSNNFISYLN